MCEKWAEQQLGCLAEDSTVFHCLDCKIVLFENHFESVSNLTIILANNSSVYMEGPGGHVSSYSIQWLTENTYQAVKRRTVQPRILWNSDIYKNANIASAKWDTFMKSDAELKAFLQIYLLYGFAFVDGVPATVEATEALSQRVGLIRYVYASCYTFIVRCHFHKAPEGFSPLLLHMCFCITCVTGRRPMEKCGLLLLICPEETLHIRTWL